MTVRKVLLSAVLFPAIIDYMKKQDNYPLYFPEQNITLDCQVIPSDRKSISIRITPEKDILIRVPKWLTQKQLTVFLSDKQDWILKTLSAIPEAPSLSIRDKNRLAALEKRYRRAAKEYIPARVSYYRKFTGGNYERIVIRDQKTRWGSCSSNGTLSFNYRLMLAPPRVLDYVVVHELCHLTHMNHSAAFWEAVGCVLPDYKRQRDWLKQHGAELSLERHLFSSGRDSTTSYPAQ